jgi:hypothetical protein
MNPNHRIRTSCHRGHELLRASAMALTGILMLGLSTTVLAQTGPVLQPQPVTIPLANPTPDANERMTMNERPTSDVVLSEKDSSARLKGISVDADKLLILARDLNHRMAHLKGRTAPAAVLRELEMMELLSKNIQLRMKLVQGSK